MKINDLLSTLIAHKSVLVPIHSVCAFLVAAHDYGAYFEGVDERALEEIYQRVLYEVWDNYGGGI